LCTVYYIPVLQKYAHPVVTRELTETGDEHKEAFLHSIM